MADDAAFRRMPAPPAGMGRSLLQRPTSPFGRIERRPRRLSETDSKSSFQARPEFGRPSRGRMSSGGAPTDDQCSEPPSKAAARVPDPDSIEAHECKGEACSVAKVFHMPELLEIIFLKLRYEDILALRQVDHRCNAVIRGSEKLRLQFLFSHGQYGRPRADFELVPLRLPGLDIRRGKEIDQGQWSEVMMKTEVARLIHPRDEVRRVRARSIYEGMRGGLGKRTGKDAWPLKNSDDEEDQFTRYGDRLVSQPPIEAMQAFVLDDTIASSSTAGDPTCGLQPQAKLHCETGITLGYLAEVMQRLRPRDNRFADGDKKDYTVLFRGIMSFSGPATKPRRNRSDQTDTNFIADY